MYQEAVRLTLRFLLFKFALVSSPGNVVLVFCLKIIRAFALFS